MENMFDIFQPLKSILDNKPLIRRKFISGDCVNTIPVTYQDLIYLLSIPQLLKPEITLTNSKAVDKILKEPHLPDEVVLYLFNDKNNKLYLSPIDDFGEECNEFEDATEEIAENKEKSKTIKNNDSKFSDELEYCITRLSEVSGIPENKIKMFVEIQQIKRKYSE